MQELKKRLLPISAKWKQTGQVGSSGGMEVGQWCVALVHSMGCACPWVILCVCWGGGGGGGGRGEGHRWTGPVSLGRRKPRITSDIGTWRGGGSV